jgi:hypothetical protein
MAKNEQKGGSHEPVISRKIEKVSHFEPRGSGVKIAPVPKWWV